MLLSITFSFHSIRTWFHFERETYQICVVWIRWTIVSTRQSSSTFGGSCQVGLDARYNPLFNPQRALRLIRFWHMQHLQSI